eukprot:GHVU01138476.1.p1 GENE.GHVU01138476.1~~GHVU01138476.1.p1  ORF type:complete len:634 (-),score=41.93 GHVU01138476.1:43-1881(-)
MSIPYRIRYLPGEANDWADLLSRWGSSSEDETLAALESHRLPWPEPEEISFPATTEIIEVQQQFLADKPNSLILDSEGVWRLAIKDDEPLDTKGPIWLPSQAEEIILRVLVIAHAYDGLHCSQDVTIQLVRKHFSWKGMQIDIRRFVRECLHCLRGSTNSMIPRPLGETLTAQWPNEVLHIDFLQLDVAVDGWKYLLIMKDDFSSFSWIRPSTTVDAETASRYLRDWCLSYSPPLWLVSDGGSHFKNKVVSQLTTVHHIRHHITIASCPWANGTVEHMVGLVLRVFRTLRSTQDRNRGNADWLELLPLVTMRINDIPYRGLSQTPRECFLNAHTGRSRTSLTGRTPWAVTLATEEQIEAARTDEVWQQFREAWEGLHKSRTEQRENLLIRSKTRKEQRYQRDVSFEIGDWVLHARPSHEEGQKLSLRWTGPNRVVAILSKFVYQIEEQVPGGLRIVRKAHYVRLKRYCDHSRGDKLVIEEKAEAHLGAYNVEAIEQFRFNQQLKRYECLIRWEGFEQEENHWEPVKAIARDVPDTLIEAVIREWHAGNKLKGLIPFIRSLVPSRLHEQLDQLLPPVKQKGSKDKKAMGAMCRENRSQPEEPPDSSDCKKDEL